MVQARIPPHAQLLQARVCVGRQPTRCVPEAQAQVKLLGRVRFVASKQYAQSAQYAVVVDAERLTPLATLDRPAVALVAARVGETRLIDNRMMDHRATGTLTSNDPHSEEGME